MDDPKPDNPPRAIVIIPTGTGTPEVHYVSVEAAREAVERHYAEREVY